MILRLDKGEHIAIDLIPETTEYFDPDESESSILQARLPLRTNVAIENNVDVRICDGRHVVKVVLSEHNMVLSVLVDDVFVWGGPPGT